MNQFEILFTGECAMPRHQMKARFSRSVISREMEKSSGMKNKTLSWPRSSMTSSGERSNLLDTQCSCDLITWNLLQKQSTWIMMEQYRITSLRSKSFSSATQSSGSVRGCTTLINCFSQASCTVLLLAVQKITCKICGTWSIPTLRRPSRFKWLERLWRTYSIWASTKDYWCSMKMMKTPQGSDSTWSNASKGKNSS